MNQGIDASKHAEQVKEMKRSMEYLVALNPGIDGMNQNLLAAE